MRSVCVSLLSSRRIELAFASSRSCSTLILVQLAFGIARCPLRYWLSHLSGLDIRGGVFLERRLVPEPSNRSGLSLDLVGFEAAFAARVPRVLLETRNRFGSAIDFASKPASVSLRRSLWHRKRASPRVDTAPGIPNPRWIKLAPLAGKLK